MRKIYFILFMLFFGVIFCAQIERKEDRLFYEGLKQINEAINLVAHNYKKSRDVSYLIKEAKMLLMLGKARRVISLLKSKQIPFDGLKLLARAYYLSGDYTSAMAIWDEISSDIVKNDDWKDLYFYAKTAEALNLYPKAIRIFHMIPVKSKFYKEAISEIRYINQGNSFSRLDKLFPKDIVKRIRLATAKKFAEASAVIIESRIRTEVLENRHVCERLYFLIKVLNDRGREKFGEVSIGYDSTYEKVKLLYARTISPDGRVTIVGKKHIRDVSLYKNFPLYSNARAMIISMPDLTDGSLIEYEVELYDNKMLANKHMVYYIMPQQDEPMLKMEDTLIFPEKMLHFSYRDVGMQYLNFQANFTPSVRHENGKVVMRWVFENVPQLIPEPNMPSIMNVVPIRILSSFKSWDQIYKWWWKLARPKLKATSRIKKKVKELTKNVVTNIDKVRKIYRYCAQEIRYVAVEYGKAGYEPHTAGEIFENKYGDCKDQAILLVTMLRSAGFHAYPVIIPTRDIINMDKKFPVVLFNHAIAVVKLGKKWIFMDPTASTCSFGDLPIPDQGRNVLIYTDKKLIISTTPIMNVDSNKLTISTWLDFTREGKILANRLVTATGFFAQGERYWLKYSMPIQIKQVLQIKAKSIIPDAKLINYDIDNLDKMDKPIILDYKFQGNSSVLINAGKYKMLPVFENISLDDVVREKRRFPIQKDGLSSTSYIYKFKFSRKFKIMFVPKPVKLDTPWFDVELEYSRGKDNSIIEFFRYINKVMSVSPKDYLLYKKTKISLVGKLKQRVLLLLKGED